MKNGFQLWKTLKKRRADLATVELLSVLIGVRNAFLPNSRAFLEIRGMREFQNVLTVYRIADEKMMREGVEPAILITRKNMSIEPYVIRIENGVYILKDRHSSIGKIIGFPPKEAEGFESIKQRVFVHYHGYFTFACEFSRLEESLPYLSEHSPVDSNTPHATPLSVTTHYTTENETRHESVAFRPEIIQAMTWEEIQYWCEVVKEMREKKRSVV